MLLRIACPNDKSGPVIGKVGCAACSRLHAWEGWVGATTERQTLPVQGGEVIRSIRDSTGARVKVDDAARGLAERPIIIFSPDR